MKTFAASAGILCIAIAFLDAFNTILVPRRIQLRFRPSRLFYAVTWAVFAAAARRIRSGRWRESLLGTYGPLSLLSLVGIWEVAFILGFGLIQWAAGMRAGGHTLALGQVLYLTATTVLTLGTGDPQNMASRILSGMEGAVGLGFVGSMISYLPVLYQSFSNRELSIATLDARAGSPPSAGRLLASNSHSDRLESELAQWEQWAAQLLESSISFPMLAFFRSQHMNQSWLSALTAMLDTAAVASVCCEDPVKRQAQLTLAMGRHALVDISSIFRAKPPGNTGDRLPTEQFQELRRLFAERQAPWRMPDSSERDLLRTRQLYEPYAEALSRYFLMALPTWLPDGRHCENWKRASGPPSKDSFAVSDPYILPDE